MGIIVISVSMAIDLYQKKMYLERGVGAKVQYSLAFNRLNPQFLKHSSEKKK